MSNVLIVMADELAASALGCAGHPVIQTPNIDRLAARGVRFERAWTPSPICVPARGSFVTGRYVHDIATWHSAQPYTGDPEGWTHAARNDGVTVASVGKLHYRSPADDVGHDESIAPMWLAGGVGWVQGLERTPLPPYPEAAELAADVGVGDTTYTSYDRRICTAACEWLNNRTAGEKWALFVSFVSPHFPLSAPAEFHELYPLDDVPPPEIGPTEHRHPVVAEMAKFWDYGAHMDTDTVQRARWAYYALTSYVDALVGELLDTLEDIGASDDTTVILTSDHGELLGNRGLWCKSFMFEEAVGVPMIVSGGDVDPSYAGRTSATRVNLVDIGPTVLDCLGLDTPGASTSAPGQSLLELIGHVDRLGFSEYHDGGSPTGFFAVAWDRWKYVHYVGARPELYDLDADPRELRDLGDDAGYASIRLDGEERLRSIVDPEAANAEAFRSQAALIESLGGVEQLGSHLRFNHTPAPGS